MKVSTLISHARRQSGMSPRELGEKVGTSRTTISQYENGTKSPTGTTIERILDATGMELALRPKVNFTKVSGYRGIPIWIPDRLTATTTAPIVKLPTRLYWSGRNIFDMNNADDVELLYASVMTNGAPDDILTYIDRETLLSIFDRMYLQPLVEAAWKPLIDAERRPQCQ